MSAKTWPPKDPNEVLDYGLDWSARLVASDTIASSLWIVPTGILSTIESNTGTTTTIWLSGGTDGETYSITNRVTTTQGRVYDQSVRIKVKTR